MSKLNPAVFELYRAHGYHIDSCDQYISRAKVFRDLFTIFDAIAVGEKIIGVQLTDWSNFSKRRTKILAAEVTPAWVRAGEIHLVGVHSIHGRFKLERFVLANGDLVALPFDLEPANL